MATRSRRPLSTSAGAGSESSAQKSDAVQSPPAAIPETALENTHDTAAEVRLHGVMQPVRAREERIARRAYQLAAQRGFAPGHALDDWLAAEREVDDEMRDEKFTPELG